MVPASSRQGYSVGCSGLSERKPVPPSRNGLHLQRRGQDQHAGPHRSVQALVSRSRQNVHAEVVHVDIQVPGALCRVENEQPPSLVGDAAISLIGNTQPVTFETCETTT